MDRLDTTTQIEQNSFRIYEFTELGVWNVGQWQTPVKQPHL